jgi:hypothetical protein
MSARSHFGAYFWWALVAWIAMLATLVAGAVIGWETRLMRDSDMSGAFELAAFLVIILGGPLTAIAFGLYAPMAMWLDACIGHTVSRANLSLATLSLPLLASVVWFVAAVALWGWPRRLPLVPLAIPVAALLAGAAVMAIGLNRLRAART